MSQDGAGLQSLEVSDFSGGVTDNFVDAPTNKYQLADNFVISDDNSLTTRPGREIYDSSYYQIPAGSSRLQTLADVESQLFQHNQRNVYYISTGWNTLTGSTSNPVFNAGTTSSFGSFCKWNRHLIGTTDAFSWPMAIYKDETSTWRVRNTGLPSLSLAGAIELANDIKTKYNAHIADATEHTAGVDAAHQTTSAAATDYDSLVTLVTELLTDYAAHEADAQLGAAWLYHAATRAVSASLTSTTAPVTLAECITRLTDLKSKLNTHDADTTAHGTDTLHQVTEVVDPVITPGANTGKSFVYAFCFYYTYKIGTVTHEWRGPLRTVSVSNADAPQTNANAISAIPTLVNGTTENFHTANVAVEIYRTTNGGTVYYYVGSVTNATTTYTDNSSDTTIAANRTLYTSGGTLEYEPPPRCKYVVQANDCVWYANTKEGSVNYPNRIRQSNKNQPSAAPHYTDVEETILGIGAIGIYPIVFCENGKIYRLEGTFNAQGQNGIVKREISRITTLISNRSIVNAKGGLFFAAEDGFYFTDGNSVQKVSGDINVSYKRIISATYKTRVTAAYDPIKDRIIFGVQQTSTSNDNDFTWVCHCRSGISANMPFTTWSGGYYTDNYAPTYFYWFNSTMLQADRRGYLLKFNEDAYTDAKINTSVAPSSWTTYAIIYDYRSPAFSMGTTRIRKWGPKVTLNADNQTSLSVSMYSHNDMTGEFVELKEIRYRGSVAWGDDTIVWGDADLRWNYLPVIRGWRRIPARSLRFIYKQVKFTNAYTIVDKSDDCGTATFSGAANTAVLDSTNTWVSDAVDYYISTEYDLYDEQFLVTARTNTTLTLQDTNNHIPTGSKKWLLKGYKKGEVLSIISYIIDFSMLTLTGGAYDGDSGENA